MDFGIYLYGAISYVTIHRNDGHTVKCICLNLERTCVLYLTHFYLRVKESKIAVTKMEWLKKQCFSTNVLLI